MALTGEPVRVGQKKDYAQLLSQGAEVLIQNGKAYSIVLPSGKGSFADAHALPYVLDAQRFARLDSNERRAFLFGLMGLSTSAADVKRRLLTKGCNEHKVEAIMPMLRAGFDAAHKEAQAKARDEKTAWRTITGETYGDKKAAAWAAEKPAVDRTVLDELQQCLAATDAGLAGANQHLGGLQADHKRHIEAAQRLAELREKSSRRARIADKLNRDQVELQEWEKKVANLKGSEHSQNAQPCPECGTLLALEHGTLVHAAPQAEDAGDDLAQLPQYEQALRLMQSTVANDKRDLTSADAAAGAIAELQAATGTAPDEAQINAARKHLDDLKAERIAITAKLAEQQNSERQTRQADERTAKALAAHEAVLVWLQIADALAPDGIPGEMLAEALTPLNQRLADSAEIAQWAGVSVARDMQVLAGGRPYALLSESEKWRTDAMLAEAVTYLSKTGLLVLDRLDVLDLQGRQDLIAWLDVLAQDSAISTALIFGTLKALPANLPKTIAAHWLQNGAVGQLRQAA